MPNDIVEDALHTNNARHIDTELPPGLPVNPESLGAVINGFDEFYNSLLEERDPDFSNTGINEATFVENPAKIAAEEAIQAAEAEVEEEMGLVIHEAPPQQSTNNHYDLAQLGELSTIPQQPGHTNHAPHATELSASIPFVKKSGNLSKADSLLARWIPTFQGGKTKMARAVTDKIKKFFGKDAEKITVIDDWFGGSGGWGGYLASAVFKNVHTIRIHEYAPDRLEKIKLFHQRGNEVGDLFKTDAIKAYIEKLTASLEESGTFSGSAISNRVDAAFEIGAHQEKLGDMADAITAAMKDQGEASFGIYGKGKSARHAVNDMIKRVTENAQNSYAMFNALRERGVKIEYIVGDSYTHPHLKGDHVLSVIDPPYYATKGYNGEKKVGIDTYNKTRLLIDRVVKDGNSLIYTDEAWFDKAISQSKKDKKTGKNIYGPDHGKTAIPKDMHKKEGGLDAKGQLLAIRSGIDALFRTPIDGRIETVGLHNGQNKPTSGDNNIGRNGEEGTDQTQRPQVGGTPEPPVRHPEGGLAGGREGDTRATAAAQAPLTLEDTLPYQIKQAHLLDPTATINVKGETRLVSEVLAEHDIAIKEAKDLEAGIEAAKRQRLPSHPQSAQDTR